MYPGIKMTSDFKNEGLMLPSYKHFRVEDYKFINDKVAKVCEIINKIDQDIMKSEDATIRHIDYTISELNDILDNTIDCDIIKQSKKDLMEHNYTFFNYIIDLVEDNLIHNIDINKLLSDFLIAHSIKIESLNNAFNSFLNNLEK